jgi:hypothetical protein
MRCFEAELFEDFHRPPAFPSLFADAGDLALANPGATDASADFAANAGREAIFGCPLRVARCVRCVHGLQAEHPEIERFERSTIAVPFSLERAENTGRLSRS